MNALRNTDLISPAQYLLDEADSPVKREYIGGAIYAMSGARNEHNLIATSLLGSLTFRLRGRKCEPYNSDTKVRIHFPSHTRFYYPDAMVVCQPNPRTDSFQDNPAVIVEVLSRRTRRTDEGEKKDAYLSIPSLKLYLMVEQESPTIVAFRRDEQGGFVRQVYRELEAIISLPEIGTELPLTEVYDRVPFGPEPDDDSPQ